MVFRRLGSRTWRLSDGVANRPESSALSRPGRHPRRDLGGVRASPAAPQLLQNWIAKNRNGDNGRRPYRPDAQTGQGASWSSAMRLSRPLRESPPFTNPATWRWPSKRRDALVESDNRRLRRRWRDAV